MIKPLVLGCLLCIILFHGLVDPSIPAAAQGGTARVIHRHLDTGKTNALSE